MTMLTTIQSAATPTIRRSLLLLVARLRRFLNGWVAAAIAYREQQAALFALRQLDDRNLDNTRIYRDPLEAASKEQRGSASSDASSSPERNDCRTSAD